MKKYQGKGTTTKMVKEALYEAESRKVNTLVAHAVEHGGRVNARRGLEKFGFKEIYSVKNYWNCLYPREYCKQCGNNTCQWVW